MLEVDPNERLTAREILDHAWLCEESISQNSEFNMTNENIAETRSAISGFSDLSSHSLHCPIARNNMQTTNEDICEEEEGLILFCLLYNLL